MDLTRRAGTERKQGKKMRIRRKTGLATLVSGAALISAALAASPAQAVLVHDFNFGSSGTGKGQLSSSAIDIAINHTTGDVYVADRGNNRIQQFDADGSFIRMWGQNVNSGTGDPNVCTDAGSPTDICGAGQASGFPGGFNNPVGVAVDSSGGPGDGSVYVQDVNNNRVQRFTANGELVAVWGKGVNQDTGGDVCTVASGDTCAAGTPSGEPGGFGLGGGAWQAPGVAVDGSGRVYVADGPRDPVPPESVPRVQQFDPAGTRLGEMSANYTRGLLTPGFQTSDDLAVDADGRTYVAGSAAGVGGSESVRQFGPDDYSPDGLTATFDKRIALGMGLSKAWSVATDPSNQYLFVQMNDPPSYCPADPDEEGAHFFEFHPGTGQLVDCTPPTIPGIDEAGSRGMAVSADHKLYALFGTQIRVFDVPAVAAPAVGAQIPRDLVSGSARIEVQISGNLSDTTAHVEYGTEGPCSVNPCQPTATVDAGASIPPQTVSILMEGLEPATTYHYRVVAENDEGTASGADQSFTTFAAQFFDESCENILARQQTGAAFLLDCRAYELVSADDQGGYNVESNLIPGQEPFVGYPRADDKALYAVHNGGVPNTGLPTNRGPDPYVATRDAENQRWNTEYVGIPADAPSMAPFSSTAADADSGLGSFAFGGDEICDPCFPDGSSGIPIRTPDGGLEQGMVGSLTVPLPEPAGGVKKHFSADGSHFLFASEQQFEPEGNPDDGNVTIYDRNLSTDITQVVSTKPDGDAFAVGADVRALDISEDGSRVLIGVLNNTDAEGNEYYNLFMHDGTSPNSLEIVSGGGGALYAGMTSDGSQVFFTTRENLDDDTDSSMDLFRATINGGVDVERVSTGNGAGDTDACDPSANSFNPQDWNVIPGGPTDCSVVALGGQAGVAEKGGAVYFLSPEQLDGGGVADSPNLFLARLGEDPHFIATLESGATSPFNLGPVASGAFGQFVDPSGVTIDSQDGSTYVMDINGDQFAIGSDFGAPGPNIQKFDTGGNLDSSFAGDGKLDGADGASFHASTSPGSIGLSAFTGSWVPPQIAVDNSGSGTAGDIYIPDVGSFGLGTPALKRYSASGVFEASLSLFGGRPIAVAVDPNNGNVYASSNSGAVFGFLSGQVFPFDFDFATGPITGLAIDSSSRLYATNGATTTVRSTPITASSPTTIDTHANRGIAVDPTNDHLYVNLVGGGIIEYDSSGTQIGGVSGTDDISDARGIAADSERIVVTDDGAGEAVEFGLGAAPGRAYDHPLVINSVRDSEVRHTADFQTTPSGEYAAFDSVLPLSGFDAAGHEELFRYDAVADQLACTSCNPTGLAPTTDASLPTHGSGLTDDGRVFFNTGEPLIMRDVNKRLDAYEWSVDTNAGPRAELISTGTHNSDSGLLTVSADGTDAFFFTRQVLAANDNNGNLMKLYTAREGGGFFALPEEPPCAASDECHGPSSEPAEPIDLGTLRGSRGNVERPEAQRCDVRRLARRAQARSRRAKALRRRAARIARRAGASRRARRTIRRFRVGARRNARAARKTAAAAKRCRRQTAARRTR